MSKYFRPAARSKLLDQISNNLTKTFTKLLTNSLPILAFNSFSTEHQVILPNSILDRISDQGKIEQF